MTMTRTLLSLALALSVLAIAPATSGATAVGYEHWGGFDASIKGQTVRIPAGQLTHVIKGGGYHVEWDGANFVSVANLCDPSMRFTYGNGSESFDGDVHWGCSHVGQWKYALDRDVPRGRACAELWTEDWARLVAKQCHYVYG